MTKQDLQKELLEKVKSGTKPSHLKRSKSLDDIPPAPPLPPTEIEQLRQENKQLKKEAQLIQAQLKELAALARNSPTLTPPQSEELKKATDLTTLLQDQLKEKQQQIELLRQQKEDLRKELEPTNPPEILTELDQSLASRVKSLKDWFTLYSQNKKLDKELEENVNEASEEIVRQDKKISSLQSQIIKLKQTNQSLQRDLDLSQRLAELRKDPPFSSPDVDSSYLHYGLYSLVALLFTLWLLPKDK